MFYLVPAVRSLGIESPKLETLDPILRSGHIPMEEDESKSMAVNRELVCELPKDGGKQIVAPFFQKHGLLIDTTTVTFDPAALNAVGNKIKWGSQILGVRLSIGSLHR